MAKGLAVGFLLRLISERSRHLIEGLSHERHAVVTVFVPTGCSHLFLDRAKREKHRICKITPRQIKPRFIGNERVQQGLGELNGMTKLIEFSVLE